MFETKNLFQDGRCCSESKEMENSLESPLHLGEYHVVTLKGRNRQMVTLQGRNQQMVSLQKMDQGVPHQRFQTVRALPSETQQYTLRQGIKYNTSNKPVSNDFNMSAGYYIKPAQRRQSLEEKLR